MPRKIAGLLSFMLCGLSLLAAPLSGQNGTVQGTITDADTGQPLATVDVSLLGGGDVPSVLSNQTGAYRFSVAPGTYFLVAQRVGYADERIDVVRVGAGQTETVNLAMRSQALLLNPITVVATRREEKALDAPANIAVVSNERIAEQVAVTPVDHVKALPGVDIAQTGISSTNVVTRGFNNIFSGSLLVITDNRYASVPSLRFNAYNMIPLTNFDPERIEVLLGPASALYGPNSANGVLHIITSSPLDNPGTAFSIAGGERSLFHGQFRHASAFSERVGVKVSGQYFRAEDWIFVDPLETRQRDFDNERWGGEVRADFRPSDNSEIIASAGVNQLVKSVEMTGQGGGQALDWRYMYGQLRYRSGRLFAQAFMNQSDAGDTFLLRTGQSVVDKSRMMAAQLQHGVDLAERLDLIYGVDLQRTEPRTDGTITGRNEDNDIIDEVGGYLHSTLAVTSQLDLVAALRADHHNRLEDLVYSPRAAVVFRPAPAQTIRATYNRAYSAPTSNNLFLDLLAIRIPVTATIGYNLQTRGVPTTGFTFNNQCAGGVQNLCMYSPLVPGQQLPAAAHTTAFWNGVINAAVPAALRPALLNPGAVPGDPALASILRRFSLENALSGNPDRFPVDAVGPQTVEPMRANITNTIELGYQGILGDRFLLAADVYQTKINDFVGPLRVETPSVFLDPVATQAFVIRRLTPLIAAGAVTQTQAADLIRTLVSIPMGTVAPDGEASTDMILTYRNFGDVEYVGADISFQFLASDRLSINSSASYMSDDCFDFNNDDRCSNAIDIALNAPKVKGSAGARWADAVRGYSVDGRVRYTDGFPMNSGSYVGTVESYALVDMNASYHLPWVPGASATLTVSNLFDDKHQEAVGAPELGRLAILRLTYQF